MRIGIGYDVHRLVGGRPLIIGGVEIPHEMGLSGHSDADVLLHAVCDALLGAAGLGDLGEHFPDSDPRYHGINSRQILKEVVSLLKERGWKPFNLDCVVIAEVPKLFPYKDQMKSNLAECLGVPKSQINVKATTEEGLGFTGTKQGIAAWGLATIVDS